MTKKYYKVCFRTHSLLYSCWVFPNTKACVTYSLNSWTYPNIKGTDLFVFDNLDDAKKFRSIVAKNRGGYCSSEFPIYEAKVQGVHKRGLFIHSAKTHLTDLALNFLGTLRAKKQKYRSDNPYAYRLENRPPRGTVFVDAVKLVKKVA
jgi:hypothetical protein